jgi:hypothetical protein
MTKASQTLTIPGVPDFLGTAGKVKIVANLLVSAQSQAAELEGLMVLNAQGLDDKIASADDDAPTYRERLAALAKGTAALLAAHADLSEEIDAEATAHRRRLAAG